MSPEERATAAGWTVTIDSRDGYVAHLGDNDEEPDHYLDAEEEDEAWAELCELEGI